MVYSGQTELLMLLSGVLGILAYVLFSFQFLLASRPKLIDRCFGMDRIYRFHMIIAILALISAFAHKMLKGIYYSESNQTELGDIAFAVFVGLSVFSILLMINKLFFRVQPVDYIRKLLDKILRIKYQYKVLLHNLMLLALVIMFIHVTWAYTFETILPLRIILIIYFAVPLATYINHKLLKRIYKSKRYVVAEVKKESEQILTLKFKPESGKVFNYLPGQFLYLKIKNREIPHDEHPFTISSSPSQKENVAVTIKRLGDFTNSLTKVKIGDKAYIDGAYGMFSYLKQKEVKKLCFIAGGVGITPFLSMLEYMNSIHYDKEVILLWGAKDISEVVRRIEIEDYAKRLSGFQFVPVLSGDISYNGEKGFITAELIKKYLEDVQEYDFYICGPPIMLDMQLKNLNSLGVPGKKIHYERFSI
jgi:predicted ferric reductase